MCIRDRDELCSGHIADIGEGDPVAKGGHTVSTAGRRAAALRSTMTVSSRVTATLALSLIHILSQSGDVQQRPVVQADREKDGKKISLKVMTLNNSRQKMTSLLFYSI